MTEASGSETPPPQLLEAIANLTEFHREHEKFYSQAPLRQAVEVQSRVARAQGAGGPLERGGPSSASGGEPVRGG